MTKIQEKVIQFLSDKTESAAINDVFNGSDLTDQEVMLSLEELKFSGLINIDSAVFSLGNVSNNIQRTLANTPIKAVLTDEGKKIVFPVKVAEKVAHIEKVETKKVEPEKKAEQKKDNKIVDVIKKKLTKK